MIEISKTVATSLRSRLACSSTKSSMCLSSIASWRWRKSASSTFLISSYSLFYSLCSSFSSKACMGVDPSGMTKGVGHVGGMNGSVLGILL